jgi:hypothetical protein
LAEQLGLGGLASNCGGLFSGLRAMTPEEIASVQNAGLQNIALNQQYQQIQQYQNMGMLGGSCTMPPILKPQKVLRVVIRDGLHAFKV